MKGCWNDPETRKNLTEEDLKAVEEFKKHLQDKQDKRDECGCHRECTTLKHKCEKPCEWPSCLTKEEKEELDREIRFDPTL